MKSLFVLFSIVIISVLCSSSFAQLKESKTWQNDLNKRYTEHKDIVYKHTNTSDQKLDLYTLKDSKEKRPVYIFIHGGGWRKGTKDSIAGQITAFMKNNWVVANVDYRLLGEALAPAAVIDCRCALYWLVAHADEYGIDKNRIVLGGTSSGGHLSLMTGLLPNDHPFNDSCGTPADFKIAAILNFYGITDVNDILSGANRRGFGVDWLGDQPGVQEVAKSVSPLTYVRSGIPPVFTVHGSSDPTVPYEQAVKLSSKMDSLGLKNKFISIEGGKHGKFSKEEMSNIYKEIGGFLKELSLPFDSDL